MNTDAFITNKTALTSVACLLRNYFRNFDSSKRQETIQLLSRSNVVRIIDVRLELIRVDGY